MLDHLAACGHVERVRSETDRRVVVSRLTAQGRRKIEAKRAAWQGRWEEALEGVSERDLRAATRVLERLGDDVRGRLPGAGEGGRPRGRCKAGSQSPRIAGWDAESLCYSRPRVACVRLVWSSPRPES